MAVKRNKKIIDGKSLFGDSGAKTGKKVQINWMWWALMIFVVGFFVFLFCFFKNRHF